MKLFVKHSNKMNRNYINTRELLDRYQANCDRIGQIADLCEKEKRERTEAETSEYNSLLRENQVLEMRMRAVATQSALADRSRIDADKVIRENVSAGRQTEIRLVRDMVMVSDAVAGGVIPIQIQDVLKPLEEGLILHKVGLSMPTGLAGEYVWPVYEAVEAQIAGEGVALSDTKIEMSKLTASPERVGIAIPVSRETINQTSGLIETIVREIMPAAVARLINRILFSTVKVTGATNLVGPFVAALGSKVTLSATPTFQELNTKMKAAVLESGVDGEHLCWTMTKSMAAILEGEPINAKGVFKPIIENGMMCGLPVFTTGCMRNGTTEYIGLGDWRYQPMGLFGQMSFIVDPYSQSRKNAVDFVLNADYATKTLRPEAFLIGEVSAAAAAAEDEEEPTA